MDGAARLALLLGLFLAAASGGVIRTRRGLLRPSANVTYEPQVWNSAPEVLRSHNCYEYALNDVFRESARGCGQALGASRSANSNAIKRCRRFFHIPGYYYQRRSKNHTTHVKHYKRTDVMCKEMIARVEADNKGTVLLRRPNGEALQHDDHCSHPSHYMAALVAGSSHFHFYRRDHICEEPEHDGKRCWSHKPGVNPARRFDDSGKGMPDLRQADRGKYTNICGYFCVPENAERKTHSARFLRPKEAAMMGAAITPRAAPTRRRRRSRSMQ